MSFTPVLRTCPLFWTFGPTNLVHCCNSQGSTFFTRVLLNAPLSTDPVVWILSIQWSLKITFQKLSTWPSSSETANNNNSVNLRFWRRLTSPTYRETVKSLEILQPQTPSGFDSCWKRLDNLTSSQNWITNPSGSKLASYFGASIG